jgi:hypothetical protein
MNLRKLIGKSEVLTGSEKSRLEELEKQCASIDEAVKRCEPWPGNAAERAAQIDLVAAAYAARPTPENLEKVLEAGRYPASGDVKQRLLAALENEKRQRMAPAHSIVRDVFRRAAEQATEERARLVEAEKKEAEEVGICFSASSRIRLLEAKIIGFRAEIKVPIPSEVDGPCPEPAPWRTRLAAFL